MEHLDALRQSHELLASLLEPLSDTDLEAPAYPTEWTVADVASHLGSGAVIMARSIDDAVAGQQTPEGFNPSVWDEWNAKEPRAKADEALGADRALLDQIAALPEADAARIRIPLGPMQLSLPAMLALRLNEHALHVWDIAVARDPAATVAPPLTALVVDNLAMIASFSAKALGNGDRQWAIATTNPDRRFTITQSDGSASLTDADAGDATPDLTLPAEAFARLVYGRLDPDHTPEVSGDAAALDDLRHVFPGF